MSKAKLTPGIFKAYDIRGVLDSTLDAAIAEQIGRAFGTAVHAKGEQTVVIGRDGRLSVPELSAALAKGLQSTGINVIDIGLVATPMLDYACPLYTSDASHELTPFCARVCRFVR